jgi:hypothetical protein
VPVLHYTPIRFAMGYRCLNGLKLPNILWSPTGQSPQTIRCQVTDEVPYGSSERLSAELFSFGMLTVADTMKTSPIPDQTPFSIGSMPVKIVSSLRPNNPPVSERSLKPASHYTPIRFTTEYRCLNGLKLPIC